MPFTFFLLFVRCDGLYNQSVGRLSISASFLPSASPRCGPARLSLLLCVVPLLTFLPCVMLFSLVVVLAILTLFFFSLRTCSSLSRFFLCVDDIHRASPASKASFPPFAPEPFVGLRSLFFSSRSYPSSSSLFVPLLSFVHILLSSSCRTRTVTHGNTYWKKSEHTRPSHSSRMLLFLLITS